MSGEVTAKLCNLCKWDDYNGYGFSLRAMKGEVGHFIFQIDENSPAFAGGLRDDDFVVEVNGVNVLSKAHKEVVTLIRQYADHVSLLVLDAASRAYFSSNSIHIEPNQIRKFMCPSKNPFTNKSGDVVSVSQESQPQLKEISIAQNSDFNRPALTNGLPNEKPSRSVTILPDQSSLLSQNSEPFVSDKDQTCISISTKPTIVNSLPNKPETGSGILKNSESPKGSIANRYGEQNGNPSSGLNKIELRNNNNNNNSDSSQKQSRRPRRCSISSSFGARATLFNEL